MKIAIVGSNGYIAGFLMNQLRDQQNEIIKIDKANANDIVYLDLENAENFEFDRLIGIDYIIFTAAISGPDKCAEDFDFCWNINVTGTKKLISEAIKRDCHVLFFSSDAVF